MRFTAVVAAIAGFIPFAAAGFQGFNVGANNADGSCKTTAQWQEAFTKLKALPAKITAVRLYASSDCNTLANAVPAAIATGTGILVGIWAEDATHYNNEKQALLNAIAAHGSNWIIAISVGSEDLYRGDTSASTMAQQVYDVRGMVRAKGVQAPVGHVDTWNAWTNGANNAVITACDFIGMDGYPYWQNVAISDAYNTFFQSLTATQNAVKGAGSNAPVWVTETSWPVSGSNQGAAVPSVQNAQTYWRSVGCKLLSTANVFWYAYQDYTANPSFGIFGSNGQPIYGIKAC